jgi:hypothetical protein
MPAELDEDVFLIGLRRRPLLDRENLDGAIHPRPWWRTVAPSGRVRPPIPSQALRRGLARSRHDQVAVFAGTAKRLLRRR